MGAPVGGKGRQAATPQRTSTPMGGQLPLGQYLNGTSGDTGTAGGKYTQPSIPQYGGATPPDNNAGGGRSPMAGPAYGLENQPWAQFNQQFKPTQPAAPAGHTMDTGAAGPRALGDALAAGGRSNMPAAGGNIAPAPAPILTAPGTMPPAHGGGTGAAPGAPRTPDSGNIPPPPEFFSPMTPEERAAYNQWYAQYGSAYRGG